MEGRVCDLKSPRGLHRLIPCLWFCLLYHSDGVWPARKHTEISSSCALSAANWCLGTISLMAALMRAEEQHQSRQRQDEDEEVQYKLGEIAVKIFVMVVLWYLLKCTSNNCFTVYSNRVQILSFIIRSAFFNIFFRSVIGN